jgi:hypothetical protein
VPDNGATATVLGAYDVEATDEQLADEVSRRADETYRTLMRRKRQAETALGLKVPAREGAADEEDGDEQPATPPNADPVQATDPSVQPQPD